MAEHPRIVLDPDVLASKPVILGTRLAVEIRDRPLGRRLDRGGDHRQLSRLSA